jgi:hypothetical protein
MKLLSRLFSNSQPAKKQKVDTVGAFAGNDPFEMYTSTLAWIRDTRKKLPNSTTYAIGPEEREEAYHQDPLLSGIITQFSKNILLGSYHLDTENNKKYEQMVKDIEQFLTDIGLLDAFREDFADFAIVHGHSYRRKDYREDVLSRLQKLDTGTIHEYTDPWDSTIKAFHQKIYVNDSWSQTSVSTTEYNSWFLPGGRTWIEGGIQERGAKTIFDAFAQKYNITDTTNLRVSGTDRLVVMDRVKYGNPAPIDSVILAIWLKRLLLTNSPNIIFRVLNPFLHIKNGVLVESSEGGEKQVISSVPSQPPEDLADIDPEQYNQMQSEYNSWVKSCKDSVKSIMKAMKEGGLYSSGPDMSMDVVESNREVSADFVKMMIDLLDEEIGQAFAFPVSLVKASGSELATSRAILEFFNTAYRGMRQEYETIADALIRERFEGSTWEYEIVNKDGNTETGTFTFEEAKPQFKLDTGNVKEELKVAQAKLYDSRRLNELKKLGASRADIQGLAEESMGMLELEKYDEQQQPNNPFAAGMQSAEPLDESDANKGDLDVKLQQAYQTARESMTNLLE